MLAQRNSYAALSNIENWCATSCMFFVVLCFNFCSPCAFAYVLHGFWWIDTFILMIWCAFGGRVKRWRLCISWKEHVNIRASARDSWKLGWYRKLFSYGAFVFLKYYLYYTIVELDILGPLLVIYKILSFLSYRVLDHIANMISILFYTKLTCWDLECFILR